MTSLIAQADDLVGSTRALRADRRQSEAIQMSENSPFRRLMPETCLGNDTSEQRAFCVNLTASAQLRLPRNPGQPRFLMGYTWLNHAYSSLCQRHDLRPAH
jgi:hypothetical protein